MFPKVNLKLRELSHEVEPEIIDIQYVVRGINSMGDLSSCSMKIRALLFETSFLFEFFRSSESTGICRIHFCPDTKLRAIDVKLPSGDTIHTAQRAPQTDKSTPMSREMQYSPEIKQAISERRRSTAANQKLQPNILEQLSIFEAKPDDINQIQVWAMLICENAENKLRMASIKVSDNSHDREILHSLEGIAGANSAFQTYWLVVLGRSLSKPGAFERLGLLSLSTENKKYTEWANKGVLTELEIV